MIASLLLSKGFYIPNLLQHSGAPPINLLPLR